MRRMKRSSCYLPCLPVRFSTPLPFHSASSGLWRPLQAGSADLKPGRHLWSTSSKPCQPSPSSVRASSQWWWYSLETTSLHHSIPVKFLAAVGLPLAPRDSRLVFSCRVITPPPVKLPSSLSLSHFLQQPRPSKLLDLRPINDNLSSQRLTWSPPFIRLMSFASSECPSNCPSIWWPLWCPSSVNCFDFVPAIFSYDFFLKPHRLFTRLTKKEPLWYLNTTLTTYIYHNCDLFVRSSALNKINIVESCFSAPQILCSRFVRDYFNIYDHFIFVFPLSDDRSFILMLLTREPLLVRYYNIFCMTKLGIKCLYNLTILSKKKLCKCLLLLYQF